jgi:hypothetical protein
MSRCCDDRLSPPCDPRFEWWIKLLFPGVFLWKIAWSRASRTNWVDMEVETRHPTMRRANTSITNAT